MLPARSCPTEVIHLVDTLAKQELVALMVLAHGIRPEADNRQAADRKGCAVVEERRSLAEVGSLVDVEGSPAAAVDSLAAEAGSLAGQMAVVVGILLVVHHTAAVEVAGRMERVGEERRSLGAAGRREVVGDS